MTSLIPFTSTHYTDAIRILNAASHQDYPINERFLSYNIIPTTGETIEGRVAIHIDEGQRGGRTAGGGGTAPAGRDRFSGRRRRDYPGIRRPDHHRSDHPGPAERDRRAPES